MSTMKEKLAKRFKNSENLRSAVLVCFGFGILISIPCAIIGPITAVSYVEAQKKLPLYDSTSCQLLNYTFLEHQCQRHNGFSWSYYTCVDEKFVISYIILNGTRIQSVIDSKARLVKHNQQQVKFFI